MEIPHAVDIVVAGIDGGVGETALLAATHCVVSVGVLGLIEEKFPVAANIGSASSVGEVVALEQALILSSPFTHGLGSTVVHAGGELALPCAVSVVDVPHATSVLEAASLVEAAILNLACTFAFTDGGVPVAERTEFAIVGGGELGAVLATFGQSGVPHAVGIGSAVLLRRSGADSDASGSVEVAEIIGFAHLGDVEESDARDLGVAATLVAASTNGVIPSA